ISDHELQTLAAGFFCSPNGYGLLFSRHQHRFRKTFQFGVQTLGFFTLPVLCTCLFWASWASNRSPIRLNSRLRGSRWLEIATFLDEAVDRSNANLLG